MTTWWHVLLKVKYFIPKLHSGRCTNLGMVETWFRAFQITLALEYLCLFSGLQFKAIPESLLYLCSLGQQPTQCHLPVPREPAVSGWSISAACTRPSGTATIFLIIQAVIKEVISHFYIKLFWEARRGNKTHSRAHPGACVHPCK